MYWNVFYRQIHAISDKVCVAVTMFDVDDEALITKLFYKNYLGVELITTSSHPSRELCYKQIYEMGDVIKSHGEFHEPSLMCPDCRQNPIDDNTEDGLCNFCQYERNESKQRKKHQLGGEANERD